MSISDFHRQGKKYEGTASDHKRIQEDIKLMFFGSSSGRVHKRKEGVSDEKRLPRNMSPMGAIPDEIEYTTTPADSIVGMEKSSSKKHRMGDVRQFNFSSTPQTSSPSFNQSQLDLNITNFNISQFIPQGDAPRPLSRAPSLNRSLLPPYKRSSIRHFYQPPINPYHLAKPSSPLGSPASRDRNSKHHIHQLHNTDDETVFDAHDVPSPFSQKNTRPQADPEPGKGGRRSRRQRVQEFTERMQRDSWSRQVRQHLIMLRLSDQVRKEGPTGKIKKSKEGRRREEFYVKFQQPHCAKDNSELKKGEVRHRKASQKGSNRASSQTRDLNSTNYTFSPSRFTLGNSSNKRSPQFQDQRPNIFSQIQKREALNSFNNTGISNQSLNRHLFCSDIFIQQQQDAIQYEYSHGHTFGKDSYQPDLDQIKKKQQEEGIQRIDTETSSNNAQQPSQAAAHNDQWARQVTSPQNQKPAEDVSEAEDDAEEFDTDIKASQRNAQNCCYCS